MRIGDTILVTTALLVVARAATAGPLQFIAHDPVSDSFFDVFADLVPPDPITPPNPITPPSPIHDLSDPTHLLLTNNVDTEALFSFGMQGRNGETFSFSQPQIDIPLGDSHHTVSLFSAQGSLGSFFDVFFDASYQDDTGRHAPFSNVPAGTPPDPIFPQGSLSIDYTLQADPPFTVEIFMLNPGGSNGDLVTFSAVPEPGSIVLFGCGLAGLIVARARRRWNSCSFASGRTLMINRLILGSAVVWLVAAGAPTADAGSVFGPIRPYEQFSDSPFASQAFTYFHLETFEEGALTAPGVTASAGVVIGPGVEIDSVEPFGSPNLGHTLFGDGPTGITFTFDAGVLGQLPTSAAIAWTDGYVPITFQAFDAANNLIGTITDNTPGDFSDGDGDPDHFRLFGAVDSGGIKSIYINSGVGVGGGIEVDDLQYGLAASVSEPVPEPSSLALWGVGLAGLAGWVRRRKNAA